MDDPIVQSPTFLTLLGAGSVTSEELALATRFAPILVAADGGARTALDHGLEPVAVIGDFDSVPPDVATRVPPSRLHQIHEQDSTDFEKTLGRVDTPLAFGVGFTGLRRDHELAAFHGLLRFPDRRCILIAQLDVIALCPPQMELDLPPTTRVSLFPLGAVRANGAGLRWSFDGLDLAPGVKIGTSNEAAEGPVRLSVDAPGLLVILPVAHLGALVTGMTTAPAAWPPRAD